MKTTAPTEVDDLLPGMVPQQLTLGTDWAVLVVVDGTERLYLVVETKGSLFADDLRGTEGAKIACGKAHFKALELDESPARSLDDVLNRGSEHRTHA